MKKRIVVVCPGRGTYTKETLNYLRQARPDFANFLRDIDERRTALGQITISELDSAEVFKPAVHTKGEHASALIYACSASDFQAIDRERYEIVAVTGNSMGWYLALAFGGALNPANAFAVINTMGSMMKDEIIGGQVIYPLIDDNWRRSSARAEAADTALARARAVPGAEAYVSIRLGGYVVFGANRIGTAALLKELPVVENYPFQLINHAAFHTPLLSGTSERGIAALPQDLFTAPNLPLIDGRGVIWQPYSTDVSKLYEYTLRHQVTETYDFTTAITVALREFAPDHLVLLGPGSSLGGSIGQILIDNKWHGLSTKGDFTLRQASADPLLLAMGRPEQRVDLL